MTKRNQKPKIILGPFKKDNVGSISLLNTVFKNNLENDYNVTPFFTNRDKGNTKLAEFNFTNITYFFKQKQNLFRLVKTNKPDIFHFSLHSFWSMEKSLVMITLAKLFGTKKTIAHLHGGSFEKFWTEISSIRKWFAKRLFKNVDLILVASTYWKVFFEKNNFPNKVHIVNNPIDEEFVREIAKRKGVKRNSDYLFIGSLGKRKGTYDLLKIAEINRNLSFVLIGTSEKTGDFETISKIIEQKKLSNIKLVKSDRLPLEEKVKYFSESGYFIFPSYTENFPLVIIEAAAAGIPIISTKVGAVPEFFKDQKNIMFIEAGNIQQINSTINQMSNDEFKAKDLGRKGHQVYKDKLALPLIVNQLKNAYKTLLKC